MLYDSGCPLYGRVYFYRGLEGDSLGHFEQRRSFGLCSMIYSIFFGLPHLTYIHREELAVGLCALLSGLDKYRTECTLYICTCIFPFPPNISQNINSLSHRAPTEMERRASWYGLASEAIERIGLLVVTNIYFYTSLSQPPSSQEYVLLE